MNGLGTTEVVHDSPDPRFNFALLGSRYELIGLMVHMLLLPKFWRMFCTIAIGAYLNEKLGGGEREREGCFSKEKRSLDAFGDVLYWVSFFKFQISIMSLQSFY